MGKTGLVELLNASAVYLLPLMNSGVYVAVAWTLPFGVTGFIINLYTIETGERKIIRISLLGVNLIFKLTTRNSQNKK